MHRLLYYWCWVVQCRGWLRQPVHASPALRTYLLLADVSRKGHDKASEEHSFGNGFVTAQLPAGRDGGFSFTLQCCQGTSSSGPNTLAPPAEEAASGRITTEIM